MLQIIFYFAVISENKWMNLDSKTDMFLGKSNHSYYAESRFTNLF